MIYGLITAVCFGLSDFMVTQATRKIQTLPALMWIQLIASILLGSYVWLQSPQVNGDLSIWGAAAAISIVNFAGTLLLYRAFEKGTLSIVSPIGSGFVVVTAVLAFVGGERLPWNSIVGVMLLVIGVMTVTWSKKSDSTQATLSGVPEAAIASLCIGFYFWAVGYITPYLGVLLPVLITRVVQLLCALACLRTRKITLPRISFSTGFILILAALLDSGALLSFNQGQSLAYTTSTTALTSLYSVVTILMAWAILKEQLARTQWIGVSVVLLGVIAVSL
ncbi:DMT family transporter [Paenibacillus sp. OAS669]|uniref:DMT family transporter n=1 Tax=Paenibacillus sp. OAS669 TaxID=2663821 RepID=UPI001A073A38|nr:DMT family transporter [Paenibacillus sp. OAS669]MBE1442540.1 drug/metabolite transporter (DMT)-like permease [Paenibacillus sp. OAS669]